MGSSDRHIRVFFYCRQCTQSFTDLYAKGVITKFVSEHDSSRVHSLDEYMIREL